MARWNDRQARVLVPLIRRISRSICSRSGMIADEREDFESFLFEVLFAGDRGALGRFRGEGSIEGYLRVSIGRLLLDYRRRRWGRWRPSGQARRLGSAAVALERLIERDGFSRWEAVRHLRFNRGVARSELDLLDLAGRVAHRGARRFEGETVLAELPAPDDRSDRPDRCLDGEEAGRVRRQLGRALQDLDPCDRRLLAQHFAGGLTLAEIARRSGRNARPLYRQLERTLARLRERLSRAGIDAGVARSVFGDPA